VISYVTESNSSGVETYTDETVYTRSGTVTYVEATTPSGGHSTLTYNTVGTETYVSGENSYGQHTQYTVSPVSSSFTYVDSTNPSAPYSEQPVYKCFLVDQSDESSY